MQKPYSSITFISRVNHDNLIKQNIDLSIVTTLAYATKHDKISFLTLTGMRYLNDTLSSFISGHYNAQLVCHYNDGIDSIETIYSRDELKSQYDKFKGNVYIPEGKYYDFKMINNHDLIVVVDPCFLGVMLESKDELLKFILACLQTQYTYNICIHPLLSVYTRLKLDEGYYSVICLNVSNSL